MQNARQSYADTEAQEIATLYKYFATVFLEPIPVPGNQKVHELLSSTKALTEVLDEETPGTALLRSWCHEASLAKRDSESEQLQRDLAVDRTRLIRGVNPQSTLPAYEEYWTPRPSGHRGSSTESQNVSACYQQAKVHFESISPERDSFIGTELCFLAHLADQEQRAINEGCEDQAQLLRKHRETFEHDHLCVWVPTYCETAKKQATTTFFQGLFTLLEAYVRAI